MGSCLLWHGAGVRRHAGMGAAPPPQPQPPAPSQRAGASLPPCPAAVRKPTPSRCCCCSPASGCREIQTYAGRVFRGHGIQLRMSSRQAGSLDLPRLRAFSVLPSSLPAPSDTPSLPPPPSPPCLPPPTRLPCPLPPPTTSPRRVTEVHEGEVEVEHKDGAKERVPFGTCIWATGIAMHPLVAALKAKLPPELQDSRR